MQDEQIDLLKSGTLLRLRPFGHTDELLVSDGSELINISLLRGKFVLFLGWEETYPAVLIKVLWNEKTICIFPDDVQEIKN